MSTHRRMPQVLVIATALALLAGCTNERGGRATPAEPSDSRPSSSAAPPTMTSASSGGLAALEPCGLLTDGERAQLRVPAGEPDTSAGNPGCDWNQPGLDSGVISVTVRASTGIGELNPSNATTVQDVTIGAHQGRRLEFPEGHCDFDLAITEKSSVTVSALITNRVAEACALAAQAVTFIEPKLPGG